MNTFDHTLASLAQNPKTWLITGCAGFIGSNLLETLLSHGQFVVGLDNFATGRQASLDEVHKLVGDAAWSRFQLIKGDIRDPQVCAEAVREVDYVLHQAALGSVPRSLNDPVTTNEVNVSGFVNMLVAARDAGVKNFVYAASSSTYGDHPALPKIEERIGKPLSPYAVTKLVNELYADVFSRSYGFNSVGLRYFNVFGKRQDPNGAYAAVIPKWVSAMIRGEEIVINGDGSTSRDFCYIDNVVQANILAATTGSENQNEVYNVAFGASTTLLALAAHLKAALNEHGIDCASDMVFKPFRRGDVLHSQADIRKAGERLGYQPQFSVERGIRQAIVWYIGQERAKR